MAPLKIHPLGKKQCICPSAIQTCAERMVPNTIMFSYVQLKYPQHIPGIFSSMRLTCCQNTFGSKIAENYSIRKQRIGIFLQNNLRRWRNIFKNIPKGVWRVGGILRPNHTTTTATTPQAAKLRKPRKPRIKGPDNPTRQLLPIMSAKGCSRDGEGRKGKGGGEGSKS